MCKSKVRVEVEACKKACSLPEGGPETFSKYLRKLTGVIEGSYKYSLLMSQFIIMEFEPYYDLLIIYFRILENTEKVLDDGLHISSSHSLYQKPIS